MMLWRILLLCLLLTGTAHAESGKVALIIANGTYANAGRLPNPTNDAQLVATAARRAGFDAVTLATDLSLTNFQRALRDFRDKAAGAQVAMVYYAGHGIEGGGKNWLIPVDAALKSDLDLPYEAIDLDRVMEAISGAKVRMVVLDACRNNPFGRSWRSSSRAVTRGLASLDVDDVLVIYSAAPGQTASDGTGANSPFATSLAKRLDQPDLPVQLLGGAVRDDVLAATGGEQRPFVSASITGTPIYLMPGRGGAAMGSAPATTAPPVAATVDQATLDALAWQGAMGANSIDAYQEYRRQFPQGRFVRLAEQNIVRLHDVGGPPLEVQRPRANPPAISSSAPALLFATSSERPLDEGELGSLSAAQLRIARNEIYARHGYVFASPDLRAYFMRFAWYRPSGGALKLNAVEQRNVRLLQEAEKARGAGN
jgi:hypothetical protein